ncbi:MAG: hypothetical protein KKD32_03715 [Proteobacteria bacterium]|nr:hypothetical protein [Pseudomonadota bacterium]MBU1586268.1 hypothetical protein [Pseudomonadota bacterium]MBU2453164.1 hypothetical protein [Pseudomonadota bacterium]MBU2630805.1 hypothetical protein [Pseudomonadota bacterium]
MKTYKTEDGKETVVPMMTETKIKAAQIWVELDEAFGNDMLGEELDDLIDEHGMGLIEKIESGELNSVDGFSKFVDDHKAVIEKNTAKKIDFYKSLGRFEK